MKHYLSVAVVFCLFVSNAQTNEIQKWSQAHPSVLLIESNDAVPAYLESLDANGVQYIVFQGEVSMSDIEAFETKRKPVPITDLDESEAMEIKKWLAEHRDVKIVKRSLFDQMDTQKQTRYVDIGALILIGETITVEDIRNY